MTTSYKNSMCFKLFPEDFLLGLAASLAAAAAANDIKSFLDVSAALDELAPGFDQDSFLEESASLAAAAAAFNRTRAKAQEHWDVNELNLQRVPTKWNQTRDQDAAYAAAYKRDVAQQRWQTLKGLRHKALLQVKKRQAQVLTWKIKLIRPIAFRAPQPWHTRATTISTRTGCNETILHFAWIISRLPEVFLALTGSNNVDVVRRIEFALRSSYSTRGQIHEVTDESGCVLVQGADGSFERVLVKPPNAVYDVESNAILERESYCEPCTVSHQGSNKTSFMLDESSRRCECCTRKANNNLSDLQLYPGARIYRPIAAAPVPYVSAKN